MEIISENIQRYGGFWRRVVANIIDGIVSLLIQTVVFLIFTGDLSYGYEFGANEIDPELLSQAGVIFLLSVIPDVIYYAGMQSSKYQATIGKMALDMKVTTVQGERISFLKGVGRYFSKILSALILMIGFIMVGIDSRKQGLHDKIVDTLVIVEE